MDTKQKFYSILENLFVGARLEGDSGFVNLMNIKTAYFDKIKKLIDQKINDEFGGNPPEVLYDQLYTFFDSYFSDGGAIFFSSTPVYKNIYAKVYSDREDTALFWKTSKLYYVKSEANYKTIENLQIGGDAEVLFDFHFDASLLRHKQANEKKELEFYFVGIKKKNGKKVIKFRVLYKNDNKYAKPIEILEAKDKAGAIKYLLQHGGNLKNKKIQMAARGLDLAKLGEKSGREIAKCEFLVKEIGDLAGAVEVEPAIAEVGEIEKYLKFKGIALDEEKIIRAFKIYKKQTEIDYFIHKDAKSFLREQFNLHFYQVIGDDMQTLFSRESLDNFKKMKAIAYQAIDYIGNFEDELKSIWLKPKFVRKSNYVFTLDRLSAKTGDTEAIAKIAKHKNFKYQIDEWIELGIVDQNFAAKHIIQNEKLAQDCQKFPIDTKFFKDLEPEIIALFDDLDNELDGRLIKSDNFQALNTLLSKYKEQVQCIYIDPPFNTGDDFAYVDKFQDSTWLSLMENRLEIARDFLKDTGSFYLHLDYRANYFGRLLLDKIFGDECLLNEIIYAYRIQGIKRNAYANKHDTLFLYTKTITENNKHRFYPEKEIQIYEKPFIDVKVKKADFSKITDKIIEKIIKSIKEKTALPDQYRNLLFNNYYAETFVRDVWDHDATKPLISGALEYQDFKTQKSEGLLRRIINNSSSMIDYVLDFFSGSGTTISVAHKLSRRWLGVEMGEHFYSVVLPRMKKVLAYDKSGISKDVADYAGGGFFKYYELEQYEDVLRNAAYNPVEGDLANIDFSLGEKQARVALDIDLVNEKAQFAFEKLYPDVDIAETISNLLGKKIKQIKDSKVIFGEDDEIDLANIDFVAHPELKKLIYW